MKRRRNIPHLCANQFKETLSRPVEFDETDDDEDAPRAKLAILRDTLEIVARAHSTLLLAKAAHIYFT